MKIYKCIKCDNTIHKHTFIYGSGLCVSCGNSKHGRYCRGKKHYCIDCGKEITRGSQTGYCISCVQIHKKTYNPERSKKHYCIKCSKAICWETYKYGNKTCMSCANKGKKASLKTRLKMSKTRKGHETSEETKAKISKANKGKKRTEEFCKKISGKNNGNYIPGLDRDYPSEFRLVSKEIRKRDNHTCQCCGMTQEEHKKKYNQILHVHHIDYNKYNLNKDNLITTCKKCNSQANYNRDYWYAYYKYILGE